MTVDEEAQLAAAFTLLLNGRDGRGVARALIAALPPKVADDLWAQFTYELGITIGMSLGPDDAKYEAESRNEWDDQHEYTVVGTDEQFRNYCRGWEWPSRDLGDAWAEARDLLLDDCVQAGLITCKVREDEGCAGINTP